MAKHLVNKPIDHEAVRWNARKLTDEEYARIFPNSKYAQREKQNEEVK